MHPLVAMTLSISCLALSAPAQAEPDFQAFKAGIEQRLRAHAFFSRISFKLVEKPPFLFCIERPAMDEQDYELAVVNSYLPFLRELMTQVESNYLEPGKLQRRPEAGGYALAVLGSAGRYVDFRTAIGDPSLAIARAHYTPSLRLAVTYQDTFSRVNTKGEERHALLHEFVHAVQHAYSADDAMPKPVWFNEGLADYRSSCTNVRTSLAEPPLQGSHTRALAFGYANPAGKLYVAPIGDLVSANSYQDIIELANKRNGGAVPPEPLLSMFYAQSEMFVRFLHEGAEGKYRNGFLRYLQAAQRGESGLAAFQAAFAVDGIQSSELLAKVDADWLAWLTGVLRQTYKKLPDLATTTTGGVGSVNVPMAPPIAFEPEGLLWSAADFTDRIDGARRLCLAGDYEAALQMLPTDEEATADKKEFLLRERERQLALRRVRDEALADLIAKNGRLSLPLDNDRLVGNVVRRDEDRIVLKVGRDEHVLPLTVMTPDVLKIEAKRLGQLAGKGRWFEVWTRWLQGESKQRLNGLLKLDYSTMVDLRNDLEDEFGAERGQAAAALIAIQRLPTTDDPEPAAEALARLRQLARTYVESPLFSRRTLPIERLARALAERAFRLDDPQALGVTGAATADQSGTLTVDYSEPAKAPDADFVALSEEQQQELPLAVNKITYAGKSGLSPAAGGYQLIGSAWLRWAVPLRSRHSVELQFVIDADFLPDFGLAVCVAPGRMIIVNPTGSVEVLDIEQQVVDTIGGGVQLMAGKTHHLRVEHDGQKTLEVKLDGQQTARVANVGRLVGGDVYIFVHSSTPVKIPKITIAGTPDPSEPQRFRDRYVSEVLRSLWR